LDTTEQKKCLRNSKNKENENIKIIFAIIAGILIIAVVVIIVIAKKNPADAYSNLVQAEEDKGKFIDSLSEKDKSDYLYHEH